MQNSMKEIDQAIEWHETVIEETREFFGNLDSVDAISDGLGADLIKQFSVCETSLDALRYVKERGGFI